MTKRVVDWRSTSALLKTCIGLRAAEDQRVDVVDALVGDGLEFEITWYSSEMPLPPACRARRAI